MTFYECFTALKRRRVLFVMVWIAVYSTCAVYKSKLLPRYHASATIEISRSPMAQMNILANPFVNKIDQIILQRVMNVNHAIISKADAYIPRKSEILGMDAKNFEAMMSRSIKVTTYDSSNLYIGADGTAPEHLAPMANAYARAAIDFSISERVRLIEEWKTYLTDRSASAKEQSAEIRRALEQLEDLRAMPPPHCGLIEEAHTPSRPIYPTQTPNVIGFWAGFLLGIFVVLNVEAIEIERREKLKSNAPTT